MKIYTRVGDGGYTYLFGGKKVRKDNDRVEAYGTVDELNSALGLAAALAKNADVQRRIGAIQRDLFVLGADLATPPKKGAPRVPRIGPAHVRRLEEEIDRMQKDLPPLRHFI
ncbi:MAG TPA: ATP:cob(I)alamin adenosyltransferase, partial [Elusimicrobiota bacterium]|nr:ATP:cob(I)alamin adenosyltransferase [Elusimicrobiota bacterium]